MAMMKTHMDTHTHTHIINMLRTTSAAGSLPSRCDTMISCHYGLPSLSATVEDVNMRFKAPVAFCDAKLMLLHASVV